MIRNIVDANDNVIGTLELPDNTSEEVWTAKLNEYKTQAILEEAAWDSIRAKRAKLFKETEWIRFRHEDELRLEQETTLTSEEYLTWIAYWQQLRDLPESSANPFEIVFPEQPT